MLLFEALTHPAYKFDSRDKVGRVLRFILPGDYRQSLAMPGLFGCIYLYLSVVLGDIDAPTLCLTLISVLLRCAVNGARN